MSETEKLATAIVAPGRSVQGTDKVYLPGETIRLPEQEILQLQKTGHLVDLNRRLVPGPNPHHIGSGRPSAHVVVHME
jgi:hypothetical protein